MLFYAPAILNSMVVGSYWTPEGHPAYFTAPSIYIYSLIRRTMIEGRRSNPQHCGLTARGAMGWEEGISSLYWPALNSHHPQGEPARGGTPTPGVSASGGQGWSVLP